MGSVEPQPFKLRLLTPGPTPVPERVALAMAQPIPHHRSPAFEAVFAECREGLKWLFGTTQEVLIHASSGTGAMEGAIVNLCRLGEEILYVNGGRFGARWGEIAAAHGLNAHEISVPWGQAVDPAVVRTALARNPKVAAVCVQATETSTGVAHPVRELAELTRSTSTCLVVDAVSALGAMPLPMDEWGIDVLLTASQKALMLPPGLSFSAASAKAWQRIAAGDLSRFYFDWRRGLASQREDHALWTPAISLLLGLAEVMRWLRAETLDRVYARHERLARATRAGMKALGLELFAQPPTVSLTTAVTPVNSDELVELLRRKYGLTLAGGQDQAKGKILRIAHLGNFDDFDIVVVVAGIERALADLGHQSAPFGTGVGAALSAMAS
jgi:aspartate aminotransferase-like enzyme